MNKVKVQLIKGESGQEYVSKSELSVGGLVISIDQSLEAWSGEQNFIKNHPELKIDEVKVSRGLGCQKSSETKKVA